MKDMERKNKNLFMDNVALQTKLTASQQTEGQQQEEITSLKKRLVQSLSAQVNIHLCSTSMVAILLIWILKCKQFLCTSYYMAARALADLSHEGAKRRVQ